MGLALNLSCTVSESFTHPPKSPSGHGLPAQGMEPICRQFIQRKEHLCATASWAGLCFPQFMRVSLIGTLGAVWRWLVATLLQHTGLWSQRTRFKSQYHNLLAELTSQCLWLLTDNKYCEDISEPEFSSHLERNLIYKVLLLGVMTDEKVSCPASEAQGCRPRLVPAMLTFAAWLEISKISPLRGTVKQLL